MCISDDCNYSSVKPLGADEEDVEFSASVADRGKGSALTELRHGCGQWGPPPLPPLRPSPTHTILIKVCTFI